MSSASTVSQAELEDALNRLALLIDRHGDGYWPIFERIEDELKESRLRANRLQARLSKLQK